MKKLSVLLVALAAVFFPKTAFSQETRLVREPAISKNNIAFAYAGDLWVADRAGQNVRRATTFQGQEAAPHFSPDGKTLAFSAEYDGNFDVFTVSVAGGEPKRLTFHPLPDVVKGWARDGKSVVFASGRENAPYDYPDHFYQISTDGGPETSLPVPRIWQGSFSPDGKKIAYQMILPWEEEFKNYRGGQNNPIRIMDLKTFDEEILPFDGARDHHPNWVGDRVFFLSDRDLAMNVWAFDTKTKKLEQLTRFKEFDCKNLASCDDALIFENAGQLFTLDLRGGEPKRLPIKVDGDFAWARPHWENVAENVTDYALSPGGKRAVFAARGDIFSVPAEKGDIRNLTNSPGAADRSPVFSPDGKRVSWFSDESGEYQIVVADVFGKVEKKIALKNPTFFYNPKWSPDSKMLAFGDADRNLWVVDIASEKISLAGNEGFAHPERVIAPEWSPDSRWVAFTKRMKNEFNAIFIYSVLDKKATQITDAMADCKSPAWDKSGKYLYFLGSTDLGLSVGWLDLSSYARPVTRSIFAAVLAKNEPSPLAPPNDEEGKPDTAAAKKDTSKVVKIDFDGLDRRIVALDLPAKNYAFLAAGAEKTLFFAEWSADPAITLDVTFSVSRHNLTDRKTEKWMDGLQSFDISADGKKALFATPDKSWTVADASLPPAPSGGGGASNGGKLKLDDLQMKVDPLAEARQIFREAWRFQRDYFYVKNVHGLDMDWALKTYAPWVEHVRHRSDLNYILDIFGGETSIAHSFVGGGDFPKVNQVPGGLLGANYEVSEGRYRFSKILTGENWNPGLKAPLVQPGIEVAVGDYLLAVNGVPLDASMNLYALFERTAGKQVKILVNSRPAKDGARELTVVPVASERMLRQLDWVESNRRKVDQLSGGKLAYVWVPNTGGEGFTYFNRWFFAQKDKKGAVVDERFNQGGYIADYIIEVLSRTNYGYFNNPLGEKQPFGAQDAAIHGPKVMLINEMAGSGGDMLPYMFKFKKIGPLVGKKTWGGLVGIWDVPGLLDGGGITAPRGGFYNLQGEWDVENIGVAPDIEVEMSAKAVNQGRDPQLERGVEACLEMLKTQGVEVLAQPKDPVRVRRPK